MLFLVKLKEMRLISSRAQIFIEALISLAVISIILLATLSVLSLAPQITFFSERGQQAHNLLQEYVAISVAQRDRLAALEGLNPNQAYRYVLTNGLWQIQTGTDTIMVSGEQFQRSLRVTTSTTNQSVKLITIMLVSTSTSEQLQLIVGPQRQAAFRQETWLQTNTEGPLPVITSQFAQHTNIATGTNLRLP